MAKSRSKPSVPQVPHNYVAIPGSERRPSKTARLIGPADPNEVLDVTIVLRRRPDGPNLPDHDYFLTTPPAQRQRMSEEEFAAKYGAVSRGHRQGRRLCAKPRLDGRGDERRRGGWRSCGARSPK